MASYTDVNNGTVWDDDIQSLIDEVEYWRSQGNDIEFYITKPIKVPDDPVHFGSNADRTMATFVSKADRQLWRRICAIVDISF